jgi:integrase
MPKKLTLKQYAETFLAERTVSPIYQMQIRMRISKLCEWAGRELRVDQLTCDLINKYLIYLQEHRDGEDDLSPYTVNAYRANILAVWNAAYLDKLNNEPPLRVRRIKRRRLLVECYTHEEISQLLNGASQLDGYDRIGNKRSEFWQALIYGAYSTGLRRGDLLNVRSADVGADGLYTTIQSKTGYRITVQFSSETLEHAANLNSSRGLLIHWPYRLGSFTWSFKRVRNHAGINRGSLRWLRRSAGSYAESIQPGAGSRTLGHRNESVFRNHYEDQSITTTKPFTPPALPKGAA